LNDDFIFRILFLVIFLAGSLIRGYYARKIPSKKRSILERLKDAAQVEGKVCAIILRAQGFYLIIVVLLYLLFSPWMLWAPNFPYPTGYGGLVLAWESYLCPFSPGFSIPSANTGPYP